MLNFTYQISKYWKFVLLAIRNFCYKQAGFSMIEFLSIIAIVIFLTGFITFSLTRTQQHTSTNTTIDSVLSDIKQQQLNAMINDTQGTGIINPYGLYFQSNKYTLFSGSAYSLADPN